MHRGKQLDLQGMNLLLGWGEMTMKTKKYNRLKLASIQDTKLVARNSKAPTLGKQTETSSLVFTYRDLQPISKKQFNRFVLKIMAFFPAQIIETNNAIKASIL